MRDADDQELMGQAAWLYYVGGLNQEETANRLGTTRARINKLLQLAKDAGMVSISIDTRSSGMLQIEDELRSRFRLERVICSPAFGLTRGQKLPGDLAEYPRRAVGTLAATLLRDHLARRPIRSSAPVGGAHSTRSPATWPALSHPAHGSSA